MRSERNGPFRNGRSATKKNANPGTIASNPATTGFQPLASEKATTGPCTGSILYDARPIVVCHFIESALCNHTCEPAAITGGETAACQTGMSTVRLPRPEAQRGQKEDADREGVTREPVRLEVYSPLR